jgi:hypothetical protein
VREATLSVPLHPGPCQRIGVRGIDQPLASVRHGVHESLRHQPHRTFDGQIEEITWKRRPERGSRSLTREGTGIHARRSKSLASNPPLAIGH